MFIKNCRSNYIQEGVVYSAKNLERGSGYPNRDPSQHNEDNQGNEGKEGNEGAKGSEGNKDMLRMKQ